MIDLIKHMRLGPAAGYIVALGLSTLTAVVLLVADSVSNHETTHGYLLWNLALAWLPLVLAVWLRHILSHKLWSSWEALVASVAWIIFLPNAFYMISDFIHLANAGLGGALNVVLLFVAFVYIGVVLGMSSLYLIHAELLKRFSRHSSAVIVMLVLLLCSFAIYIGRDLRWNSWDILVNPTGLLFDVSERAMHPAQYPTILAFVVPLFLLLSSMYVLVLASIRLASRQRVV